jgi:hypothetical protein
VNVFRLQENGAGFVRKTGGKKTSSFIKQKVTLSYTFFVNRTQHWNASLIDAK